jgi:hypothetical protein
MIKLFNIIRLNGSKHLQHSVPVRQVVYFNMIWMFSYLTILLNTVAALFIYQSQYSFFIIVVRDKKIKGGFSTLLYYT